MLLKLLEIKNKNKNKKNSGQEKPERMLAKLPCVAVLSLGICLIILKHKTKVFPGGWGKKTNATITPFGCRQGWESVC